MITNRELGLDDYLAMARRQWKLAVIPALICLPLGLLLSFAFRPKYNSQSLVLVEDQVVPQGYVKPVVTQDVIPRVVTLEQQVLGRNRLRPMVERLGLARKGKTVADEIEEIRANVAVIPIQAGVVPTGSSSSSAGTTPASTLASTSAKKKPTPNGNSTAVVPAFNVSFTTDNARDAQQVCAEITSMILSENLASREQVAQSTADFISRQLEDAKHTLDAIDVRMAAFKRQHLGQLPSELDSNLKILAGLYSQLEANTQTLNRAQQDKSYNESLLATQMAAWRSTQASEERQSLQQEITTLQNQQVTLESRYTDDHPDVIKARNDIAALKTKLQTADAAETAKLSLSPELEQLRLQVHQYDSLIAQSNEDQKRLQQQIEAYQRRVALSPEVEQEYAALARDQDSAQKLYSNLLANRSESEMQSEMERQQVGEQMRVLSPASLPDSPSFPNRLLFAAGGLGAGLGIGVAIAFWRELRDKSMRNEADIVAGLELPLLASVPWVDAGKRQGGGVRGGLFPFRQKRAV